MASRVSATTTDGLPLREKNSQNGAFLFLMKGGTEMARPSKPTSLIEFEGKSHRTKKEIEERKKVEDQLLSKVPLKESQEVKNNPIAHKQFSRVKKLLKNIQKNDELYGSVINRYCLLLAECSDLEVKREKFYELTIELKEEFKVATKDMDEVTRAGYLLEFSNSIARMTNSMINCDKQIQSKRKMLLDIEKECVMTIASSLRSIPKQIDETKDDPLLKILRGG